MQRRRFKQTLTLEARLAEEAKRLREEAKLLPPGALREELIRRARRAETACHMNSGSRRPAFVLLSDHLGFRGFTTALKARSAPLAVIDSITPGCYLNHHPGPTACRFFD